MQDTYHRFGPVITAVRWVLLCFASCQKALPPDPLCRYESLPESVPVSPGKGAFQVAAATEDYFYVIDPAGTELTHNKLGRPVALAAGNYRVKMGSESRPVTVVAGSEAAVNG